MSQGVPRMILTLVTRPGLLNTTLGTRVFLVCDGNFRCWPKADTSSAVGRSHEFRAGHYKDFTETGTCAGKVSAPRVVEHAPVTFSGMSVARGFLAVTHSCCTPLCDYCT